MTSLRLMAHTVSHCLAKRFLHTVYVFSLQTRIAGIPQPRKKRLCGNWKSGCSCCRGDVCARTGFVFYFANCLLSVLFSVCPDRNQFFVHSRFGYRCVVVSGWNAQVVRVVQTPYKPPLRSSAPNTSRIAPEQVFVFVCRVCVSFVPIHHAVIVVRIAFDGIDRRCAVLFCAGRRARSC